jgi:hypothetical protein
VNDQYYGFWSYEQIKIVKTYCVYRNENGDLVNLSMLDKSENPKTGFTDLICVGKFDKNAWVKTVDIC